MFSLQITVVATLRRHMELRAGQVEEASWEVLKVGAKVLLERWFSIILSLSFRLPLTQLLGHIWQRHP